MQCVLETPEGLVEDVRGGEEDGGNSTVQCKNKSGLNQLCACFLQSEGNNELPLSC